MKTTKELIESLTNESKELDVKLDKLEKFLRHANPDKVSFTQHHLLQLQCCAMLQYRDILTARINDFMYSEELKNSIPKLDLTSIKNGDWFKENPRDDMNFNEYIKKEFNNAKS